MKGTQLIPSSTEEDSQSVSVEPTGTGMATTMQVSLAKRIVQPGTNRVVCLAAQTTVPMEEDDIASVSDLALRLSDGTNVRVSMSFFNDVAFGAGFGETSARRFYDPDWYENHRAQDSSNRLWLVIAALTAIAFGSFCYFLPGGIDKLAAEIVARMPRIASPIMINASSSKSAAPPVAQHATISTAAIPSNRKSKKAAKGQSIKTSHRYGKSQDGSIKVSHSGYSSKSMLIPPPPPTAFAIPISQMAVYNMPPYTMPNSPMEIPAKSASSKSKAKPTKPLTLEIPKDGATIDNALYSHNESISARSKVSNQSKPTISPEMNALFPEPARAYSRPRISPSSYAAERSEKPTTTRGAQSQFAPLPGGATPTQSEQPQLERIDLLN